MGWESRNGKGRYYTRSHKVHGRVVREYLGTGFAAEVAAEMDAQDAAERAVCQMRIRETKAELCALDATMHAAHQWMLDELRTALQAKGFHEHKREWRRKRGDNA